MWLLHAFEQILREDIKYTVSITLFGLSEGEYMNA